MKYVIATALFGAGLLGVYWHVTATAAKDLFVGTEREIRAVVGAFMSITCLPAAVMVAMSRLL